MPTSRFWKGGGRCRVEHQFEIMFVTRLFLMFVIERFMRVFFDKRRTRFPVMALSYLAFPLGLTAGVALLAFLGEKPIVLAMILQTAPAVALLYVIALNYEEQAQNLFTCIRLVRQPLNMR